MAEQPTLFDLPALADPDYVLRVVRVPVAPAPLLTDTTEDPITRAFWRFHEANPEVYRMLVRLARDLVARGHAKVGIGMLFEVLRWRSMLTTTDETSPFRLNNNYRSRFARLIMDHEPDLAGRFDVRELASEKMG